MKKILAQIKDHLQDQGYTTDLIAMNETHTVFQLVVDLDDELGLRMTVFYLVDLLKIDSAQDEIKEITDRIEENKVNFLQLFIRFPFELQEDAVSDLARLQLMMNWSTPIGAFGINESKKMIYYRHVFECIDEEPSISLILDAIYGMEYYAGLRFDSLMSVGSGEKAIEGYLQALEQEQRREEEFPGYDL